MPYSSPFALRTNIIQSNYVMVFSKSRISSWPPTELGNSRVYWTLKVCGQSAARNAFAYFRKNRKISTLASKS